MRRPVLFVTAALLLAACQHQHPLPEAPTAEPELVLRTYTVPPGYGDRVAGVLQRVLPHDKARVNEGPNGEVLVVGSESLQAGVGELIERVQANVAQVPPPSNIAIEYWAVWGDPADEPVANPRLKPVAAALDAIEEGAGVPMSFELLAKNRIITLDGNRGAIKSREGFSVEHHASIDPATGALIADIGIDRHGLGPEVRVRLQPGQWLVLGEVGRSEPGRDSTLYYLARAEVTGG